MGAWYFKQPNGLYGRFSTVVDTITHCNLTKEELYQDFVDRFGKYDFDVINFDDFIDSYGKEQHRSFYLHNFEDVISDMTDSNEDTDTAREALILCGYPKEEAEKLYFMDYPEDADEDDPIWETYDCTLQKKENLN